MKHVSRRQFLKYLGLGSLAVLSAGTGRRTLAARPSGGDDVPFVPDVEIALRAEPAQVAILPGAKTDVWVYRARVLSGPSDAILSLPDTYLGPVMRWRKGQRVRVRFTNDIPEESIVHWHGLHVPEAADGHRASSSSAVRRTPTSSGSTTRRARTGITPTRMGGRGRRRTGGWPG